MKKKIFFLINSLEGGGAENVVRKLSSWLSDKYDITIITLKNKAFYDVKNIKLINLLNVKSNIFPLFFPIYINKLKNLIKKEKPDHLISFLEWANFLNVMSNKNAIVSLRIHMDFFKGFKGFIYRILIKRLYPKAKNIIVNSYENKEDLSKQLNCNNIEVLYNPIEQKRNSKVKKEYKFISVGRLIDVKHFDKLIIEFSKVCKKNDKFVIIGDGPKKSNLKQLIRKLNLQDNVSLLGRQKDVYKFLNQSQYFIYASEVEGFPNVLLEAMDAKLPIITTDFKSGAREVIDPSLNFNVKLKYPYYGPNGILLDKFTLKNIDFKNIKQNQKGIERFKEQNVLKQFEAIISY
jgi:N-acetylgalactosamine-N,N'-diacetylbacillosaminyl-diphospho-undecaprenol 4-alpha-N-acetylgalactosaminyltransferase